jgi:hypothetical protein
MAQPVMLLTYIRKGRVQNSAGTHTNVFSLFSSIFPANVGVVREDGSRPFPSAAFPIHYSL